MKCGSTTLHQLLAPYADIIAANSIFQKPIGKHDNARQVKSFIESKGYKWEDFYVFTTIREPFSRIKSCYKYERECKYIESDLKLEDYIKMGRYHSHFRDIDYFTSPGVNKVIRMEDFDTEIPLLWERLGLGVFKGEVPHLNVTQSSKQKITEKNSLIKVLKKRHQSDYAYYS